MARLPGLRPVLLRLVLAQLSAVGATACCGETAPLQADVDLRQPSEEMADLLARCARDAQDCSALCDAALKQVVGDEQFTYSYLLECTLSVTAGGAGPIVHLVYEDGSTCGRAPTGLASSGRVTCDDPVAAWLAHAAHLEAASVVAFVRLAVDLARLGAPAALVARAMDAAHDEVEHASLMRELARERGIDVMPVECDRYQPAGLLELALHNAREGCVRETLGAAINMWQARNASDPAIRQVFARIADDEASHADVSWQIHEWARSQLSAEDRHQVAQALSRAQTAMIELGAGSSEEVRRVLGLPTAAEAQRLARAVIAQLAA